MSAASHCRERMQILTQMYLAGTGGGEIYECCFLTYLEVIQAAEGRDPDQIWDKWREVLKSEYDSEVPLNRKLGDSPAGRAALILRLEQFALQFALPRRRDFSPPPSRVVEVEEHVQPSRFRLDEAFDEAFGDDE